RHQDSVAGPRKMYRSSLGKHRPKAVDACVADMMNGCLVHPFGQEMPHGRCARREMEVRETRDPAPEPFLRERIGKRPAAPTRLDMRECDGNIVRCPRSAVGGKRISL